MTFSELDGMPCAKAQKDGAGSMPGTGLSLT